MGAAARVTSRGGDTGQVRPGAAVRDAGWDGRRGAAAESGGDIGGRGQVAVAGELASRAGQHPPGRFGDPAGTGRAGGGGTALVDQDQADPRRLGLVFERGTRSGGCLRATGIRSRLPSSVKVPWYQRSGTSARRRRGNRAV
jgi:hypothetical protein